MRADRFAQRAIMDDSSPPKFTVNQIMLLQRLKQTGLSKSQILKGLEEMEKLEDIGLCSPGLRYVFYFNTVEMAEFTFMLEYRSKNLKLLLFFGLNLQTFRF